MMRDAKPARTWIYFIQAGTDGPVKIGITRNPRRRLASLQQANAEELRVLGLYRCYRLEERQLHDELAPACIRGEWFEPTPSVLSLAASLGGDIGIEDFPT